MTRNELATLLRAIANADPATLRALADELEERPPRRQRRPGRATPEGRRRARAAAKRLGIEPDAPE